MTSEEKAKRIEEILNEAKKKIHALKEERALLFKERHDRLQEYIKDLESQKIDKIRSSLGL